MQHVYTKLINSAKKKNVFLDLTFVDFLKFTEILNCTYCSKYIDWNSVNRYNLDRKVNNIGYTFNNLVVCCWECNNTKSNRFTHEEFILLSEGLQLIQKLRNERTY